MTINASPEFVWSVVGGLLSLIFTFMPGLNIKYAGLPSNVKSAIMLVLIVAISFILYLLNCYGVIVVIGMVCGNIALLVELIWFTALSNQVVYMLTPQPKAVTLAINERVAG